MVSRFDDIIVAGEFFLLTHPFHYNAVDYYICKIITFHPITFIQLAAFTDNINVKPIKPPINRHYVYYPREIVLTNIGCTIANDQLNLVAIIVSPSEIENCGIGSLASIRNVFLLRSQIDVSINIVSFATRQTTFVTLRHDSYTLRAINLILKIVAVLKEALNCRALNQQQNVTQTTFLSFHEWKYITTHLAIPVEICDSNKGTTVSRDHGTQENMKKKHEKECIRIDSDEKVQLFQNVFGKHSLMGYRVRPPTSCKKKWVDNQTACYIPPKKSKIKSASIAFTI